MTYKIDLEKYLFHGIKVHQDFFCEPRNPKEEAKILKKILGTGFISSRKNLQGILTKEEYEKMEHWSYADWNGMDNVSIAFNPNFDSIYNQRGLEEYNYLSKNDLKYIYYSYIEKFPSIILDSRLLNELRIRPETYNKCIGEIQIEDKIPSRYFVGITLPNILTREELERVAKNAGSLNEQLTIIRKNLLEGTAEDFVDEYYKDVILFEEVLNESHLRLNLYHIETGQPILPSNEEIELVKRLKKIVP